MNTVQQNKVGRLLEKHTKKNIKCVDCETELTRTNYSWVDLVCKCCGATFEVKATMKNEEMMYNIGVSGGAYDGFKNLVANKNVKHYMIVYQYKFVTSDIICVKRCMLFDFRRQTEIYVYASFERYNNITRKRANIMLDVSKAVDVGMRGFLLNVMV